MGARVLVTGVTRYLGSSLCGRLVDHRDVSRVIGVDAVEPDGAALDRMGGAEYLRLDIRNPAIGRLIADATIDVVIHVSAAPGSADNRALVKELNVIGTMQLLAGCQRAPTVRSVIACSSSAVYGTSSRDPAVFSENTSSRDAPASGPARDINDAEAYLRSFARRRPDVRVVVPRFAEVIGPTVCTPLTRYLSLSPFVPVPIGQAPRLQLIHESDAVEAIMCLFDSDFIGPVNVAADGVVMLSQAVRRAGRTPLPLPTEAITLLGRALCAMPYGAFSPEQVQLVANARVMDTSRLKKTVGFTPAWSTSAAYDDFAGTLTAAQPHTALKRLVSFAQARLDARDRL